MSDLRLDATGSDAISQIEMEAFQDRFAPEMRTFDVDDRQVTLEAIAEAAGMSLNEVLAHVRQIRAEAAFVQPPARQLPRLVLFGAAALSVAIALTTWRIWKSNEDTKMLPSNLSPIVQTTVLSEGARHEPTISFPRDMLAVSDLYLPSGLSITITGQNTKLLIQGRGGAGQTAVPVPYDYSISTLVENSQKGLSRLYEREGPNPPLASAVYQMEGGGTFSPRSGFGHVSMQGWVGSTMGYIALPVSGGSRNDLRKMAVELLSDAKQVQDEALQPVSDPRDGIVLPPPGYEIEFVGRRRDRQQGPRISFSGIPVEKVAARLEAALLNAAFRDRRPPTGPWSGSAAADAKIPQPKLSRVEVRGLYSANWGEPVVTDLPTEPGKEAETRQVIKKLAAELASRMIIVNERGERERKLK